MNQRPSSKTPVNQICSQEIVYTDNYLRRDQDLNNN